MTSDQEEDAGNQETQIMDAVGEAKIGPNPQAALRDARAEQYFQHDLAGQRRWYGERASRYKSYASVLGMAVLAAGAITSFLQVFRNETWTPVLTAVLGALVAVAEGWRQIARYNETWAAYRLASERMKRERRLYVNGAGEYRGLGDEAEAFLCFVEAIEAIIAEEQRIYWQVRSDRDRRVSDDTTVGDHPTESGDDKL